MKLYLSKYKEILFDLDGVLANTNETKRRNILAAAITVDPNKAKAFTAFFTANNGITRERKIAIWYNPTDAQNLLLQYNALNAATLNECKLLPGAARLLHKLHANDVTVHIFTGGDEQESITLCEATEISRLVAGIHGGPRSKSENVYAGSHQKPAIFFGDSRADYDFAIEHGFNFVFVYGNTQFTGWQQFFERISTIQIICSLDEVIIDKEI